MSLISANDIDAILPQMQCGLCGYGGCMPYAEALSDMQAAINLCPPGGVDVLRELGALLDVDPAPYVSEMSNKAKPSVAAVIREDECIGCAKCILACPVDAIIGSAKNMHAVIASECTGCELCVAPCPVDCIDLVEVPEIDVKHMADAARMRFKARTARLQLEKSADKKTQTHKRIAEDTLENKKSYIQEAIARAQKKKQSLV